MHVNEISSSHMGEIHMQYLIKDVSPEVVERMRRKPYHSFTGRNIMGDYTKFMKERKKK